MVCKSRVSVPLYVLFIVLLGILILTRTLYLHPSTNRFIDSIIHNHTDYVIGALGLPQGASTSSVIETTPSGVGGVVVNVQTPRRPDGGREGGRGVGGEREGGAEKVGGGNNRNVEEDKIIKAVIFTTWLHDPEKTTVRGNVLRTWGSWRPKIIPHLFSDDERVRTLAKIHGFGFQTEPKKACGGVPVYREMFRQSMKVYDSVLYGFVNGDILLGDGILASLEAVVDMPFVKTDPVMVVLRRINVDFINRPPIHDLHNISLIAKQGRNMTDGSSDGIFTNRLFPWDHVPDIVVGRIGIAMWMVSYAREMGAHVIDISDTTIAVHMTTKAGLKESWKHGNVRCNHAVFNTLQIKPQTWFCGFIRCAGYKTAYVTNQYNVTQVKVVDKRSTNHIRCGECHMDLNPLLKTVF